MTLIEKIKNAEAEGDLTKVMRTLGELLEGDFRDYVGKATNGFSKFLKGGVFSARYREAFWNSDLPARFGSRWAGNKLCGYAFWRALLAEPAVHLGLLSQLTRECPVHVATGLRRHRTFLDESKWPVVSAVLLRNGLGEFVEDCNVLRSAQARSEARLHEFTSLLTKISAETLVLHFAIWLEKVYFNSEDDRDFRIRIPEKVEILEQALVLRAKVADSSSASAKTIDELKKLVAVTYSKIRNNPRGQSESEALFDAVDQQLAIAHVVELFCSMDWEVKNGPHGLSLHPANEEQKTAWVLHQAKFHAMDTFEVWCPITAEEHSDMKSCSVGAANRHSADTRWHAYTAERFLAKHCGRDVTDAAEAKMGFSVEEAVAVLLCNRACYEMTFAAPRAESKANQGTYLDSLGITATPRIWHDTMIGATTLVSRLPFEPRDCNELTENAAKFPLTEHIPSVRVRRVYDFFSQDIHAGPIGLGNKLLLRNQHCDLLLPRIFAGDVKTFLFNHLFEEKTFTRQISEIFESRIEDIFRWRKFKTLRGRKLGDDGEVDVLAFRDGTLFVIEAKCTRLRAKASEVRHVRERLAEGAAQLHRMHESLPKYWAELHSELEASSHLHDLQVIPLLVSNSLEFDHLYFEGILKISDFELEMIFANRPLANVALNGYHQMQFEAPVVLECAIKMRERFNSLEFEDIEKFALYPPGLEPSVEELIACIEESRFWAKVFGRSVELTLLGAF